MNQCNVVNVMAQYNLYSYSMIQIIFFKVNQTQYQILNLKFKSFSNVTHLAKSKAK